MAPGGEIIIVMTWGLPKLCLGDHNCITFNCAWQNSGIVLKRHLPKAGMVKHSEVSVALWGM